MCVLSLCATNKLHRHAPLRKSRSIGTSHGQTLRRCVQGTQLL